jgi:uncharacterized protein (DUF2147 family)
MAGFARIALAGLLSICAVAPALASPSGVWELETRDTRFQLEMCGDGTQLCGKLVWLSDVDYNEQYKPYLNAPMAREMKPVANGRWQGDMMLFGYKMSGTLTQDSADQMTLQGCAFLVVCKTYKMFRKSE